MNGLKTRIEEVLNRTVQNGVISRASVTVVGSLVGSTEVSVGSLGSATINGNTRFDVASVTKVVPVSTLALIALDREMVSLEDDVAQLCPDIKLKSSQPVRYKHLLTQTLDFQFSMSSFKECSAQEIWDTIRHAELKSDPGDSFFYCNATSVLLGKVLESLWGKPLDILADEFLFTPLGMKNSGFRPQESERGSIVPTENDPWRGRVIQGEIHDESSWVLNEIMIPGAAGLFSTSNDLGRYLRMILDENNTLFSSGFLNQCAKNWISNVPNAATGLGFEYDQEYMGTERSSMTIGKTGFTGSVIVADLKRKRGFSLLTDYTWPVRKKDRAGINQLRKEISDLVWTATE